VHPTNFHPDHIASFVKHLVVDWCQHHSVSASIGVSTTQCQHELVSAPLGVSTTRCQHHSVSAPLGVSTNWCQHELVSAPLGVSTNWCQHHSVSARIGVSTNWCQHHSVSARAGLSTTQAVPAPIGVSTRPSCARDPVGGSKEEGARGRRVGQRTRWRSVYAFGNSLWKSLSDRDKLSR
jgi:hypothetical protein